MCQIITLLWIHLQSKKTLHIYHICLWNNHSCAHSYNFYLYSSSYRYDHFVLKIERSHHFFNIASSFLKYLLNSRCQCIKSVLPQKIYISKIVFCNFNLVTMPKMFSYVVQNGKQWLASNIKRFSLHETKIWNNIPCRVDNKNREL